MNNILYTLTIIFLCSSMSSAQVDFKNPLSVANIPSSLLDNANVVIRKYDLNYIVKNKGEAEGTEHKIITILNEKAENYCEQYFYYSKLSEVEEIEASVYDASGKLVKKIKKKDISDFKPYENYVTDTRYKKIDFPRLSLPYTIEYKVKTKYNGLMFYPLFSPQENPNESVENAHFQIVTPIDLKFRVKELNINSAVKKTDNEWLFSNITAFKPEPFLPANQISSPTVLTAPTNFSIEGFDGNMESWKEYGKFLYQLAQDKKQLPSELVSKLKEMTKHCTDDFCKIQKVYEFLQNNTRYFYVGLGIGGWQPEAAKEVDQHKYGDCKGLSNYTVAMLNAIDIPAKYVIIRAGEKELNQYPDFPNAWFNHAIACVPLKNDTIWLECTSQTESCGFLSHFTDSRPALVVGSEGGELVMTPKYDEKINKKIKTVSLSLDTEGNGILKSKDFYYGIFENTPSFFAEMSKEAKKEYLYSILNNNNFELIDFKFERKKERLASVNQEIVLKLPNIASKSGNRLFVPINILSCWNSIPPQVSQRIHPIQAHSRGFMEKDKVEIEIPKGYKIENGFSAVSIATSFGKYELSFEQKDTKILVNREFTVNNSVQSKDKYQELTNFFKTVVKSDKIKLVLIKE